MSEHEKQEGQKTVVAFIAGLLIGGLLVWIFAAPQAPTSTETTDEPEVSETDAPNGDNSESETPTPSDNETSSVSESVPTLPTGDGSISVADQAAGDRIALTSAEFPTAEGWVAVRDYEGEVIGGILGAARYSESQGLIPEEVELLRSTEAGKTYAVVFFTEDGSLTEAGNLYFDPAGDQQIDGILTTFTAN